MKYRYAIFVESDLEEEQLLEKLEPLGFEDIFVEKFHDIDSIIADQNNFIDENFDEKLARVLASKVIPSPELEKRIAEIIENEPHKSMQLICRAIYEAGVEQGLPDYRIARILKGVIVFLN